jgi:hypothetical protein
MVPSKMSFLQETYSDDDEPPDCEILTWRLDPETSLSDWTIEINEHTYHVHKNILAVGPRRSLHFCKRFQSNHRSKIELNPLAASCFHQLLDYLYDDSQLDLRTENATALHWLGGYFEMRRLRWEVKQFWQHDMSTETCGTYLEHARILKDEKIASAAAAYCATHIADISTSSRLCHVPDSNFWLTLLLNKLPISTELSLHLSKLIAAYCTNNRVEAATFLQLTQVRFLPAIDLAAAVGLIDLERTIVAPDTLSDLQRRCIAVLIDQWDTAWYRDEGFRNVLQQSPLVIGQIMVQSLDTVLNDRTQTDDKLRSLAVQEDLEADKRQLEIDRKQLEQDKRQLEATTRDQKSYIERLETDVHRLQEQNKRLEADKKHASKENNELEEWTKKQLEHFQEIHISHLGQIEDGLKGRIKKMKGSFKQELHRELSHFHRLPAPDYDSYYKEHGHKTHCEYEVITVKDRELSRRLIPDNTRKNACMQAVRIKGKVYPLFFFKPGD